MKAKFIFLISALTALAACTGEYDRTPAEHDIYVNASKLNLFVGDIYQLKASPATGSFTWQSNDPSIASVSDAGQVTAVSEGSTDIIVTDNTSGIQTQVFVAAKNRIYLDSIALDNSFVVLNPNTTFQPVVTTVPVDINQPYELEWTIDNPAVATVSDNGLITPVGTGTATATVRSGDIENHVTIVATKSVDRTKWTITGFSSRGDWDSPGSGTEPKVLLTNETWWDNDNAHFWSSANWDPLPCWIIVDLGETKTLASFTIIRTMDRPTKTVQIYIADETIDPSALAAGDDNSQWQFFGQVMFTTPSWNWGNLDFTLTFSIDDIAKMKTGRYLKLFFPDTYWTGDGGQKQAISVMQFYTI